MEVFRLQRHFLLASVGRIDTDNPTTGTGPGQAFKIMEVKQMPNYGVDHRQVKN